jgi:hypothetical protein
VDGTCGIVDTKKKKKIQTTSESFLNSSLGRVAVASFVNRDNRFVFGS